MEHWFDRLSRPHSRRAMLKGVAATGAALALPWVRVPSAWATPTEPCFKPCNDAATKEWNDARAFCVRNYVAGTSFPAILSVGGSPAGSVLQLLLGGVAGEQCKSAAELAWHRDLLKCRGSECGDSAKYPGGKPKKPVQKCVPGQEVQCGDTCCNIVDECCQCKNGGAYMCCSVGRCEKTPDRGGCCP